MVIIHIMKRLYHGALVRLLLWCPIDSGPVVIVRSMDDDGGQ